MFPYMLHMRLPLEQTLESPLSTHIRTQKQDGTERIQNNMPNWSSGKI